MVSRILCLIVLSFAVLAQPVAGELPYRTDWIVVKLKTHSAGGITDKDFALARRIEEAALWRPSQGGALEGTPNKFVRSGDPRS